MEKKWLFRLTSFSYNYYFTCWIVSTIFAFKSKKTVFSGGYNEHVCQIADGANKRVLTNFIGSVNGFGILKAIQSLRMFLHNIDTKIVYN